MSDSQLATLNPDGSAPKSRMPEAANAYALYQRLVNYNMARSEKNAKILAAIDRVPPVDPKRLAKEGLSFMSNVNWGYLEGDVQSAMAPYYNLLKDVPDYMTVRVEVPGATPAQNQFYGEIISQQVTESLDHWTDFDYNLQMVISNMIKISPGVAFFKDKEDFRFDVAPIGTIYVDNEITQELSKLNYIFFFYQWKVTDLYAELVKNRDNPDSGWDEKFVQQVIIDTLMNYGYGNGVSQYRQWEFWENKFRDNDIWLVQADPQVKCAWFYVREFDGRITRGLIPVAVGTPLKGKKSKDAVSWMYRFESEYDCWDQILHPFFGELGNGHFNGTKGIGVKAYAARDAQNRLANKNLDAAIQSATPFLYADTEDAAEALQIIPHGPYNVVNRALEIIPAQSMSAPIDKIMAVKNNLEYDLRNNLASSRANMSNPDSVQPISAQQAEFQAAQENQVSLMDQTRFLGYADGLYKEMFSRLAIEPRTPSSDNPLLDWEKIVADFHKRLKSHGVPKEALDPKNVRCVKAYRSIGRGSAILKQQAAGQAYGILSNDPNTPQDVRVNALRNYVASIVGREALQNIWPANIAGPQVATDASKAQDENAGMLLGVLPIYDPSQDALAHATVHLQFYAQQMQQIQGQPGQPQQEAPDPSAFLRYAQVALQHIQITLQNMGGARGKGSAYQQLWNGFQTVRSQTQAIAQQYQEKQAAAALQQQKNQQQLQQAQLTGQLLDPESQIKLARVHADAQIKAMETAGNLHIKQVKTAADIADKTVHTRQKLAINDVTTANKIKNENRKTTQARSSTATPGAE